MASISIFHCIHKKVASKIHSQTTMSEKYPIGTRAESGKKRTIYVPSICPGEDMSEPPLADETLALSACSDGILKWENELHHRQQIGLTLICRCMYWC
jgi:hypothetical protein